MEGVLPIRVDGDALLFPHRVIHDAVGVDDGNAGPIFEGDLLIEGDDVSQFDVFGGSLLDDDARSRGEGGDRVIGELTVHRVGEDIDEA